jgi:BASS family bile acid:Na+ symporter
MGKMATVGLVPTVFGSLMNITGATLATWWRDRPTGEDGAVEPVVYSKKGTPAGA